MSWSTSATATRPNAPGRALAPWPAIDNNTASIVDCFAVVTVQYDWNAATPILGALMGTLDMEGESRFQVDFNCEGPECPIGES